MRSLVMAKRDGGSVEISAESLVDLTGALRGDLISAGDAAYGMARKIWNGMIDKKPAAIVRCTGPADVIAAVRWARRHNLYTAIRSGGHNVAGAALAENGLVVDLSGMRSVRVDPHQRLARVEGGARLGDLDHETQPFNLATAVGVVSATGVAGLTLHGGIGWLVRKHGLAIDNLTGADIVTADGQLRQVNTLENPDLFWALKGGGGNFGVVTSFEFQLHPIGSQVWLAMPIYPLERATEVLMEFQRYMTTAPEELMVIAVCWSAPNIEEVPAEQRGKPVVILLGCYSGPLEQGEEILAPLRNIGQPIADLSCPMAWVDMQKILDADYPDGAFYYWKSIFLDRLDGEVSEALAKHALSRPSPQSSLDIWALGGAMQRVGINDTPFCKREAPFMLGIEANWHERQQSDANIAWAREVFEDMHRFSGGGYYLNFPGYLEQREKLLLGAYGPNLDRLRAIKAQYDPDNFFPGAINLVG